MKIALIGNPNSGKTTLYNALTGSMQQVGNWTGVTVSKKEALLKEEFNTRDLGITVIDLPGAYSMNPYTSEEKVTKDYIMDENPDIIINIVDSTNLSRSLFFTTQILELGIPVVMALNKTDVISKKGTKINVVTLSKYLNCPVVQTSAVNNEKDNGLQKLIDVCIKRYNIKIKQISPSIEGLKKSNNEKEYKYNDKKRFAFVNEIVVEVERKQISSKALTIQDKVDRIIAHKWFGILFFAIVMYFIFAISQSLLGPFFADWLVSILESFQMLVANLLVNANPLLSTLLVDGIIGGVIAVIGFLPLIMILFFLMALLEDCGYMARVAVVMDPFFKKVGLSGKSIIPMVIGTGCGIPGVMASRTIRDERQRKTTAMLTPFMPCGAKLPIIALFAGVFFQGSVIISTSMYFLAIIVILISAVIIRKITSDNSVSYFILELPEYRMPSFKRAVVSMFSRAKAFIIKATTIILVCNVVIQIMQTFTWHLTVSQTAEESILASVATPLAILFIPLGFGMWQFAAASITGFIAKENVVGTLAVVFGISNFIDPDSLELVNSAANSVQSAFGISAVAALSFLVFNLFTPPCFACIGAIRAEMNSAKWTLGAIGFQLAVGYTLSFFIYQIGTLLTTGTLGSGFIPGMLIEVTIFLSIGYLMYGNKKIN